MLAAATTGHAQAVGTGAPIRTQQGAIQGAAGKVEGVTVFKNIPFAAPPVGEQRWRRDEVWRRLHAESGTAALPA